MAGKLKRLATEKPTQVKISNFNEKITRNSQEQTIKEKTSDYCNFKSGKKKKKTAVNINGFWGHILDLTNKDFKETIINIFKDL